jgi:hypothetical protein
MKGKWNTRKAVALALVTLLALLVSTASVGSAAPTIQDATVAITITTTQITWRPLIEHGGIIFTVSGPDFYLQQEYGPRALPTFKSTDSADNPLTDGIYVYQLQFMPVDDGATPSSVDDAERGIAPASSEEPLVHAGAFTVEGGLFVVPAIEEDDEDLDETVLAPTDVCYSDDLVVDGSFCVGFDCVCNMSFGFDTIVLKENNLRIFFDDTSTAASFPRNDWRITINDSVNGGASYFGIDDATAGRSPFRIEAGAPSYSLYVDDGGRVGLGTSTPSLELHIVDGDTPAVRLQQDGSSGFAPQTWDVAGNETNFFIRDVTNGSQLPLRIRPGAPSNSIFIDTDGDLGLGTSSPSGRLDVRSSSGSAYLLVVQDGGNVGIGTSAPDEPLHIEGNRPAIKLTTTDDTGGIAFSLFTAGIDNVVGTTDWAAIGVKGNADNSFDYLWFGNAYNDNWMVIEDGGNVGIGTTSPGYLLEVDGLAGKPGGGTWSDSSDARLKENIEPIDGQHALAVLNQLQGVTFEWINPGEHSAGTQAGLIAQDVEEVFPDWVEEVEPKGSDAALIPEGEKAKAVHFPHDFNAYVVEAVKELDAQNQTLAKTVAEQDAKIAALEQQNADLEARLTALEEAAGATKSTTSLPLSGLLLGGLVVVGIVASRRRIAR